MLELQGQQSANVTLASAQWWLQQDFSVGNGAYKKISWMTSYTQMAGKLWIRGKEGDSIVDIGN